MPADRHTPNEFDNRVQEHTGDWLRCEDVSTIQVNIGLKCNLQCVHCHVSSSPKRKEEMTWDIMKHILDAATKVDCKLVDITGGAPEMNPDFRRFVEALDDMGIPVIVRTNLTILLQPGYEDLPDFFRRHEVHLVASLPCYVESNVDGQRGAGVYADSVAAIKRLNAVGYGYDERLPLSLVYNPVDPHLPPNQASLEADYRRELDARFGIAFTNLFTIANMPIGRYIGVLKKAGKLDEYRQLLRESFNPATIDGLMCRHQVNVDWDGNIYDCDFNLALKMAVDHGAPSHIRDFDPLAHGRRRIVTGAHCFGCTAGCGSSCGGALL
jgi:radical SAM/Cys-rich protein